MTNKIIQHTALSYAEKLGFAIFPLQPKSKLPATKHGFKDASKEASAISAWWQSVSDYNVAVATGKVSGIWVLDIDGKEGQSDLDSLIAKHGALPQTPVQKTSNGKHYFFRYPQNAEIKNTGKLIRHQQINGAKVGGIEVRGDGGYVVIAPSIHPDTGERYQWAVKPSATPFAEAPQWLIDFVTAGRQAGQKDALEVAYRPKAGLAVNTPQGQQVVVSKRYAENLIAENLNNLANTPEGDRNNTLNITALRLGHCIPAFISEQNAVARLYNVALQIGLPAREAMATIASGLGKGMQEPWRESTLEELAAYLAQKEAASGGVVQDMANTVPEATETQAYDAETGEVIQLDAPQAIAEEQKPLKFSFVDFDAITNMPPVNWIVDKVFPERSFGVIYGAPKKGKSFVAIDIALCVASGLPWHGHEVKQGNVLYIVGEGLGGLGKRLKAWRQHNMPEGGKIAFYGLTAKVNMRSPDEVSEVIRSIKAMGTDFKLVIIDTVARALLGGDENSSKDMGEFINACDTIKDATGAAVIGIHHSGKDEDRGMRGSSALLGGVDTCIVVKRDEDVIKVEMVEQKDAEPIEEKAFKMTKVDVGLLETSIILEPTENTANYQKQLNATEHNAMQFLYDAIAQKPIVVRGCQGTSFSLWRDVCYNRKLSMGSDDSNHRAFRRISQRLRDLGYVGVENDAVWIVKNVACEAFKNDADFGGKNDDEF